MNGVLRGAVRSKESIVYPDAGKDPRQYLALKEFHPDWLVKRWLKQFGFEGAQALCRFDNEPPPLTLRVNTLVIDRKTLLASLQEDGFGSRTFQMVRRWYRLYQDPGAQCFVQ